MRSAPLFQVTIVPSSCFPMMASSEDSTIAASHRWASMGFTPEATRRLRYDRQATRVPNAVAVGSIFPVRLSDIVVAIPLSESRPPRNRYPAYVNPSLHDTNNESGHPTL